MDEGGTRPMVTFPSASKTLVVDPAQHGQTWRHSLSGSAVEGSQALRGYRATSSRHTAAKVGERHRPPADGRASALNAAEMSGERNRPKEADVEAHGPPTLVTSNC